ncbi:MAG: hypothetical protein KBT09_09970 [Bacteroidales bacterium]|nr:hypothetical protein [Candidatus Sodaliphilus fimicaballi]
MNGDSAVDIADLNILINNILGLDKATKGCDLNNDGAVDIADANILINIILGVN